MSIPITKCKCCESLCCVLLGKILRFFHFLVDHLDLSLCELIFCIKILVFKNGEALLEAFS